MSEKLVKKTNVEKELTVEELRKKKMQDSVVITDKSYSVADSEGTVRTLNGGIGRW